MTNINAWIGGFKNSNKTWSWSDGSMWTGFGNWYHSLFLNQADNKDDKNYLMFNYWGNKGVWNDATNREKQGSLCQYDPMPCEIGWRYSEHNNFCYKLVKVKTNWTEAIRTCRKATTNPSANLASIPDFQTNCFLAKITKFSGSKCVKWQF